MRTNEDIKLRGNPSEPTISCCQATGLIHVIDFSRADKGHFYTCCALAIDKDKCHILVRGPQHITCPTCIQEYAQKLDAEYASVISSIRVLRMRVFDIRDILVCFQKGHGITNKGFDAVLQKVTTPVDGDAPLGRPRQGSYVSCKGCGKVIYVRPFRKREDGNYCKACANKLFRPPIPVKGGGHRQAGLQVGLSELSRCPKCGTKTLVRDGTDLHCWLCGHIIYYVFTEAAT